MRTYEQFENKIVKGGRALNATTPSCHRQTWRQLYALWEQGKLRQFYEGETLLGRPAGYIETRGFGLHGRAPGPRPRCP